LKKSSMVKVTKKKVKMKKNLNSKSCLTKSYSMTNSSNRDRAVRLALLALALKHLSPGQ